LNLRLAEDANLRHSRSEKSGRANRKTKKSEPQMLKSATNSRGSNTDRKYVITQVRHWTIERNIFYRRHSPI